MQDGRRGHYRRPEHGGLRHCDAALALGAGQRVGNLDGENVRGQEFVGAVPVVLPQPVGLVGVGLGDDPLESRTRITDVPHESRSSRIAGTPMSRTPYFSNNSFRMACARSRTRFATSGGTGFPAATASATACTSE